MIYLYAALFTGLVGFLIGNKKGYGLQGFIAGALLSVIGWIWIATLKPRWRCPECGGAVEQGYTKCKNCGADLKAQMPTQKPIGSESPGSPRVNQTAKKRPVAGYVLLALVIIFLIIVYVNKGNISFSDMGSSNPGPRAITLNQYLQLRDGASYSEVVLILGRSGEESSRNKIDAIPGVMGAVETVMYQWTSEGGGNMNVIFQNDRLIQKAQFGLK